MKNISYTMAFWVLRIWLGTRALFTGLSKFQGETTVLKPEIAEAFKDDKDMMEAMMQDPNSVDYVKTVGFDHYEALPETGAMSIESFKESPFMPEFMVGPYANMLGYALIILGISLLLGIFSRVSLFLMGLLYVSLTYGFIILEPDMGPASAAGIAYLGVHIIMIVAGLALAQYNRLEVLSCDTVLKLAKKNEKIANILNKVK